MREDAAEGAPEPRAEGGDAKKKSRLGDLGARLLTAVVVVPLLLLLLYWAPKWGFLVLVGVATIVGAAELFHMTMPAHRAQQAWGVVASLGVAAVLLWQPSPALMVTAVLGLVAGGFLFGLFAPEPVESAGSRMGWLVAGPLYVGGTLAAIGLLHQRDNGGSWVVLTMMLAWFGDTGAYFAGRAFGKHKLYPRVSPKKTLEGAAGGLAGSVVGVLLAYFWYLPEIRPGGLAPAIGLAIGAGALGQAGDLMESLVKRSTGVKDSGWIVPGHGGLLDRIDALMWTAAATWAYAWWVVEPAAG